MSCFSASSADRSAACRNTHLSFVKQLSKVKQLIKIKAASTSLQYHAKYDNEAGTFIHLAGLPRSHSRFT